MPLKPLVKKAAAVYALYPKNGREVMRDLDKIGDEEKLMTAIVRLATTDPEKKLEGSVVTKNLISILYLVANVAKGEIKPEFAKLMIAKEAAEGLRAITPSQGIFAGLLGSSEEPAIVTQYKQFIAQANAEVEFVLKQQTSNDSKEARDLIFKCLMAESHLAKKFDELGTEEKPKVTAIHVKLGKALSQILQAGDAKAAEAATSGCVNLKSALSEVKFTTKSPKSAEMFRHISFFVDSELSPLERYLRSANEVIELAEKQKLPWGIASQRFADYEFCVSTYKELQDNSIRPTSEAEKQAIEQFRFSSAY